MPTMLYWDSKYDLKVLYNEPVPPKSDQEKYNEFMRKYYSVIKDKVERKKEKEKRDKKDKSAETKAAADLDEQLSEILGGDEDEEDEEGTGTP